MALRFHIVEKMRIILSRILLVAMTIAVSNANAWGEDWHLNNSDINQQRHLLEGAIKSVILKEDVKNAEALLYKIDENKLYVPEKGIYYLCKGLVDESKENDNAKNYYEKAWRELNKVDDTKIDSLSFNMQLTIMMAKGSLSWYFASSRESVLDGLSYFHRAISFYYNNMSNNDDYSLAILAFIFNEISNKITDDSLDSLPIDNQFTVLLVKALKESYNPLPGSIMIGINYFQRALLLYQQNPNGELSIEDWNFLIGVFSSIDDSYLDLLPFHMQRDLLFVKGIAFENPQYMQQAFDISIEHNYCNDKTFVQILEFLFNYYSKTKDNSNTLADKLSKIDKNLLTPDIKRIILVYQSSYNRQLNNIQVLMLLLEELINISIENNYYDDVLISSISAVRDVYNYHFKQDIADAKFESIMAHIDNHLLSTDSLPVNVYSSLLYFKGLIEKNKEKAAALLEEARNNYIEQGLIRDNYYMRICNELSNVLIAQNKNNDAEKVLGQMIVECDEMMDIEPQIAFQADSILYDLYKANGDTTLADRIFYTKVLPYKIKMMFGELSGKIVVQSVDNNKILAASYQGGNNERDLDYIVEFGDVLSSFELFDYALACYNDCIKKAQHLESNKDISTAYTGRIQVALLSPKHSYLYDTFYDDAYKYIQNCKSDFFNEAWLEIHIGSLLFKIGDNSSETLKSALQHYEKAQACLGAKDTRRRLEVEIGIAEIQLFLRDDIKTINDKIEELSSNTDRYGINGKEKNIYLHEVYYYLGKYYLDKGDIDNAINILKDACRYASSDNIYEIYKLLLTAYLKTTDKNYDNAKYEFAKAKSEFDKTYFGVILPETQELLKQIKGK